MPCFVNEYNQANTSFLRDYTALSTVGNAVCGAHCMLKKYNIESTQKSLTEEKILKNDHLNLIGKTLLEGHLFASNNDIAEGNTRDYATGFEAAIGFVSLINLEKAFYILDMYLK